MKDKVLKIIKHPMFTGSFVMVVGTNLGNFFAYLYHLIIGRMLGPSAYGDLASIISLVGFLSITFGFLSLVIVKFSSGLDKKELPAFFNWVTKRALIAGSAVSIIVFLLSAPISNFLNMQILPVLMVGPILFVLFMGLIYTSFLQGLLRFNELVVSTIVGLFIRLLLGVLLVYIGFAVFGAIVGVFLSSVIGLGIAIYFLRDFFGKKGKSFSFTKSKEVFSYAVPIFIVTIATNSMYTTDVILVKHFLSPHLAGIYASLSTMSKIIFYGTAPIASVMFPLVSKTFSQGGNHKKVFFFSLILTSLVICGLILIYWLFPGLLLQILYGDKYLEGAGYLIWFGIFIGLFAIVSLTLNYFLSKGTTKVVYMALVAAAAQALGIWFYHKDIFQIIMVSIWTSLILLVSLLIYLRYEAGIGSNPRLQSRKDNRQNA